MAVDEAHSNVSRPNLKHEAKRSKVKLPDAEPSCILDPDVPNFDGEKNASVKFDSFYIDSRHTWSFECARVIQF